MKMLATLCAAAALAACADDTASTTAPPYNTRTTIAAPAEAGTTYFGDDGVFRCPPGTTAWGDAPPLGYEVWCELPNGLEHGPAVTWHWNGVRILETGYWRGLEHGWRVGYHHLQGTPVTETRYFEGAQCWRDIRYDLDGSVTRDDELDPCPPEPGAWGP